MRTRFLIGGLSGVLLAGCSGGPVSLGDESGDGGSDATFTAATPDASRPSADSATSDSSSVSIGAAGEAGLDAGADVDAGYGSCAASTLATASNVSSGCNATTAPFTAEGSGAPAVVGGELSITTESAATGQLIGVTFGSVPSSVGETYAISADGGTGSIASLYYQQEIVPGEDLPQVWRAAGGTVTITALSACFVSFTYSQAAMVPTATFEFEDAGPDSSAGDGGPVIANAAGTFTLNGSTSHAWLPCGSLTASFSAATGNVTTSAFPATAPTVTNGTAFSASASYLPVPNLNEPREIFINMAGPVAPGQSYPITGTATSSTATLAYIQSDNGTIGADECWWASSGTLTVTSLDDCTMGFSVTGATLAAQDPSSSPNGACNGLQDGTGTFTLSVTGAGAPVSQ